MLIEHKLKNSNSACIAFLLIYSFHSHSRVFNNDPNSYPKISVKRLLAYK